MTGCSNIHALLHGFLHRFNFICRNFAIVLCCIICSMLNHFCSVKLYFAVTQFLSLTDVSSAVVLSAVNQTRLEWSLWQRGCNSFSHFPMALVWVSHIVWQLIHALCCGVTYQFSDLVFVLLCRFSFAVTGILHENYMLRSSGKCNPAVVLFNLYLLHLGKWNWHLDRL